MVDGCAVIVANDDFVVVLVVVFESFGVFVLTVVVTVVLTVVIVVDIGCRIRSEVFRLLSLKVRAK